MEIVTTVSPAVPILFGALGILFGLGLLASWARGKNRNDIE